MKKYLLIPLVAVAVLVYGRLSYYTVDASEYAYVTVLGEHLRTHDGGDSVNGAGLKFGYPWPIEQVQRIDRRLQYFDLPETEQLTHNPDGNTVDKNLMLQAYVVWKISDKDGVDRFVRRIGTAKRAREILAPEINGRLGAAIGQKRMDDFISTAVVNAESGLTKVDVNVEKLRQELLANLKGPLREKYGIELVDIRLRRFNHPASVRDSIFARIRSERSKEATRYQSEGEFKAANTLSKAEEEVRVALAEARREEQRLKAEADIAAMRILNQAAAEDPEFYAFLKKMENLQSIVGDQKTMLLLSTHRPMFEALFKEPRPKVEAPNGKDKKGDK